MMLSRAMHVLLFDRGTSEMSQLRGWYRRIEWWKLGTRRRQVRALVGVLAAPVRAVSESRTAVRRLGRSIAEVSGVSPARQFAELLWLRMRHGLLPDSYYQFQLYRPERWARAARYVQNDEGIVLGWTVAMRYEEASRILGDKRRFGEWALAHALPVASILAEFQDGSVEPAQVELPARDLFSKPVALWGGTGAATWRWREDGRYEGASDVPMSAAELLGHLQHLSREMPQVLQLRLQNHPAIADQSAGGLCTVRLITIWPAGGEPSALRATYRMPVGGSAADNFDGGGLAAPVELATGVVGTALRKDPERSVAPHERHPTTGAQIGGRTLPCWADVVQLGTAAHAALPRTLIVGWDIGITPDGPVLVEGNRKPCVVLAQMPSGEPLGDSAWAPAVLQELRQQFVVKS